MAINKQCDTFNVKFKASTTIENQEIEHKIRREKSVMMLKLV